MTREAVEQIWKSYLEAYGNVSTEERKRLLRECVSDSVVSTNPGEQTKSFESLVAHVDQFQQRIPGAYFKNNKLLFHHEQLLAEWTLYKRDDTPLRTANTYARFDDQGRLAEITGFY